MVKNIYVPLLAIFCFFLTITGCKKDKLSATTPVTASLTNILTNFRINGAVCAFIDTSKTFYYPVTPGSTLTNYTVNFDSTKVQSITFGTTKITNSGTSVAESLTTNQQVKIQAYDKSNHVVNYTLVITGLAVVEITVPDTITANDENGTLNLVNPNYQAEGSRLQISSNIQIAIRGGTSRAYPKNSWAMKLVDAQGNDSDVSLLGLRTDNSWILDAAYIDQSRMRNRVCTDVWNSFNNVPYIASQPTALNGTRGYMSEVFLNNKYWGIYCLTEKLDRKQLQLSKSSGNMYKADFMETTTEFQGIEPYDNTSETWGGWELTYPDIGDSPAPNWGNLYNEVNFISNTSQTDFTNGAAAHVDINNAVDYYILMNIFDMQDNESKNFYFSFYNSTDTAFFFSAWDMDGSIGRYWNGNLAPNFNIGDGTNNLIDRLNVWNVGNFKQLLKNRWNALKTNQLSVATISARIDLYGNQLNNTNAFTRERSRWGNITQDLPTETQYMKAWYSAQFTLVDGYINAL